MSQDLTFERVIDAEPEAVFDAFTERGGQEAFYGEDDPGWIVESECDLRVGGCGASHSDLRKASCVATGTSFR